MRRKKITTSKRLLWWSVGVFMAVAVISVVAVFALQDPTPLIYLIPASAAFVTATSAFYLDKSKKENTSGGIIHDTAMAQLITDPEKETESGG